MCVLVIITVTIVSVAIPIVLLNKIRSVSIKNVMQMYTYYTDTCIHIHIASLC